MKKAVKRVMNSVVSGKSVFFHCAVGNDRTGTLAYLLEGILGVSKNDRYNDYELSYLYREEKGSGLTRTSSGKIIKLHDEISEYNKEKYGEEKFINWYLDGSSDKSGDIDLINKFRKAMIDGNPKTYKISNLII